MRRSSPLIIGAWLVHVAAWFLPAWNGLVGLSGWQAFLFVSRTLWTPSNSYDNWYTAALALLSIITTVLFLVGSPWAVFRGSRSALRASAWSAAVAFVVNAHWYALSGSDRSA